MDLIQILSMTGLKQEARVKAEEDDLKRRLLDEALGEPADSPLSEASESEPEFRPPKVRTAEKQPRRYLRPDQLTFLGKFFEITSYFCLYTTG